MITGMIFNKILKAGILMSGIFAAIIFIFAAQTKAQLDPAFGTNGILTVIEPSEQWPVATFALPGGKILLVLQVLPANREYEFVRFNADGSFDNTYGNGGRVRLPIPFINVNYNIYGAARQSDGKIILVGGDSGKGVILRFNEDGTLDTSFAGGGVIRPDINPNQNDVITCALVQPDGKIVVAGSTSSPNGTTLFRYDSNGTLDAGFGFVDYSTSTSINPLALSMQSTGKIIILVRSGIRRYNADGTGDATFPVLPRIYDAMAVQADDKIIAASRVTTAESFDRSNIDTVISRLNSDGSVDSGFGTAGSVTFAFARYIDEAAFAINVLADGQILISGYAYVPPNRSKYKDGVGTAALLSSTGNVNGKYLIPGFKGVVSATGYGQPNVVILPNGKVLFAGITFINNPHPLNYDLQMAQITGVPAGSYRFKNNPFDFKLEYNGMADIKVFRPSNSTWYSGGVFGLPGDILAPADYMHAGFDTEIAVFRPSNGTWYISPNANSGPTNITAVQWGLNGDIPIPADYDGDAKADLAVFRPSTGAWYIRNSSDNSMTAMYWGLNGDKPVPGDYDGDGRDDIAVFRPSNGTWYIIRSTDGMLFVNFGLSGDVPVQDDYDGDSKTDISVWRPSSGVWYRINSSDSSIGGMAWGLPDDLAVPADYDGDGKTDIAIWRPNSSLWYLYQSSTNQMQVYSYGLSTDIPVAARH